MVAIRALDSVSDLERVTDLEIAIWDVDPRDAVPASLMHASVLNGGVVLGAFDEERIVGIAYAFPCQRGRKWMLWSHMTGVHPDYQGQRIGFALKQAQRRWALERDCAYIAWTFDPLQRGNAHFSLHLLGATASIYHVDFYGEMTDGINTGLPSDRVEVQWDLRSGRVTSLADENSVASFVEDYPADQFLLKAGDEGQPLRCECASSATAHFVEIPFDLGHLKHNQPGLAYDWRVTLRHVLQDAIARGFALVDFVVVQRRCWYVCYPAVPWYLYVLECSDNSLYAGVTLDVIRRVAQHNSGKGAVYTASHRPVKLIAAWQFAGRASALRAERRFKKLSRQQKLDYVGRGLSFLDAPPCLLTGMM